MSIGIIIMRIDLIFFLISFILQISIFVLIKQSYQKSILMSIVSMGIGVLSALFFWNNAILIDELGTSGNIFSFSFFVLSLIICLMNIYCIFDKKT